MLQLKVPFSTSETEVLMRCLSQLEAKQKDSVVSTSNPSAAKNDMKYLISAKKKVNSHVFDSFYHDEIIHMVYALDLLSRECSNQLNEKTPVADAQELSHTLRTAASARAKLRRAVIE